MNDYNVVSSASTDLLLLSIPCVCDIEHDSPHKNTIHIVVWMNTEKGQWLESWDTGLFTAVSSVTVRCFVHALSPLMLIIVTVNVIVCWESLDDAWRDGTLLRRARREGTDEGERGWGGGGGDSEIAVLHQTKKTGSAHREDVGRAPKTWILQKISCQL